MTRLDWWAGVILVIGCSFIGNGAIAGMWMHWSREWWHYILPFCLGGTMGMAVMSVMAAAARADAVARRYRVPQMPTTGLGAVIGKWPGDETDEEVQEALDALS